MELAVSRWRDRSSIAGPKAVLARSSNAKDGRARMRRMTASCCCSPSDRIAGQSCSMSSPPARCATESRPASWMAARICSSGISGSRPVRINWSRSVPGVRYGCWGRKRILSRGGRLIFPFSVDHIPAVARNRATRAASFGPVTSTPRPAGNRHRRCSATSGPSSRGDRSVSHS